MLADDRPDYPMIFTLRLRFDGRLDPDKFRAAARSATDHHPLLRARPASGGRPAGGRRGQPGRTRTRGAADRLDLRRRPRLGRIERPDRPRRGTPITHPGSARAPVELDGGPVPSLLLRRPRSVQFLEAVLRHYDGAVPPPPTYPGCPDAVAWEPLGRSTCCVHRATSAASSPSSGTPLNRCGRVGLPRNGTSRTGILIRWERTNGQAPCRVAAE